MFPTGKPHVSYSEVRNWKECAFRHKLQQIDKIDMFKPSPYLDFGTNVHEGCESFLKTKTIDREKLLSNIREAWEKYGFDDPEWVSRQPGWYKYKPLETWLKWANDMWDDVPAYLDNQFPGWETVEAEEALYEPIEGRDLKFKGFIDAIIKVPRPNGTWKYWILDWKTANTYGWRTNKKRDPLVQAQLILYKDFWAKKHNIEPKDIACGFILLKRGAKKGSVCAIVDVSAGPKTTERSVKLLKNMISSVSNKMYLKNRSSCMFCEYSNTEYCT